MSKLINCIIDTHSRLEREELCNYLDETQQFDDIDGFQLIGIINNLIGPVGVIVANDLVTNHHYKHFHSVKEYISYIQGGK